MRFKNMRKIKKVVAISVLFGGSLLVTKKGDEVYAMFGKKSTTSAQGAIPKITVKSSGGVSVGKVRSVIQDSSGDIGKRNSLLAKIKKSFDKTGGQGLHLQSIKNLLDHEPDKYKRDLGKGIRSHTHIDLSNDIKVKLNLGIDSGKLESVIVKTEGKRLYVNAETKERIITEVKSKTESGGAIGIQSKVSDEKIQDVNASKKKGYSPQVGSQKLIDNVYKTKGLNEELLKSAIKNYEGDVEITKLEKVYRFSGEDNNNMIIYTLDDGTLTSVYILNGGSRLEKDYGDDFLTKNLGSVSSRESQLELKYKPQVGSQKLIDDVHKVKGENQGLLYKAVSGYNGDVEITASEDIYRFSGNDGNILLIHMDKNGMITDIFLKNGDDILEKSYNGVGELVFYKPGYFEVPGSKSVIEKSIYKQTDEKGNTYYLAEEKDGTFTKVLEKGGDMFVNVLSTREASIYGNIKEQKIVEAKNKYGESKRVILEGITIDGKKTTVAYQLDDGVWRDVTISDNGTLWLGDIVKYESLLTEVASKLRKISKLYARYGAPVVSGATGISRMISGLNK